MLHGSEYPAARMIAADSSNFRMASRESYSLVIVHITDGHADPVPVAQMWQTPHHGSSAHFVVGQSGDVIQAVSLRDVAWHAHARNGTSVGIEHCARSPRELNAADAGLPLTDAQLQSSAALVAWLLQRAGLPCDRQHVMGHAEADAETSHADCPEGVAGGWPWERYMALVRSFMDGAAAL